MYIARQTVTVNASRLNDYLALFAKWEVEVGMRVGWKPNSIRVLVARIGRPESEVQFEVSAEDLNELERAWSDLARNADHTRYQREFASLTVPGSSRWDVFEVHDVLPER